MSDKTLDLGDLLIDQRDDPLSEYSILSFTNEGQDTKLTITTVEEQPIVYTAVISGVNVESLRTLFIYSEDQGGDF